FDINNANLTIQQVQQQSTIPSGVTLAPGMDTGTSGSDNITNLNNSSGKTLQFVVSGTIPGALVKLYATGVVIGSATASGSTTTITPTGTIADNPYNMRATQTESGKSESNLSGITLVTIDTLAPSISVPASFDFEALPLQIIYGFSENVQPSLASSDVAITNSTNPQATIPGSSFLYTSATNKAQLQFAGVLPDGEYAAKITAADITDVAGNALASNDTFNFFFLAADGDRNEVVDISDFNILAVNFGTSAKTFSQGNYDYSADQAVTITDFNVLAIQFGKTTLSAGQTSVQALAVTESSSSSSGALPLRNDVNLLDDVGLV
ncbi:MAG TPA: Ig-like domain-containing protein, partial [Tepidisphaeraceae bacterium]|nr:Ig-like domain-containing protein [Tepidisphaeraceae bacterium]